MKPGNLPSSSVQQISAFSDDLKYQHMTLTLQQITTSSTRAVKLSLLENAYSRTLFLEGAINTVK